VQHSGLHPLLYPEVCLGTSRCDVDPFGQLEAAFMKTFSRVSLSDCFELIHSKKISTGAVGQPQAYIKVNM